MKDDTDFVITRLSAIDEMQIDAADTAEYCCT